MHIRLEFGWNSVGFGSLRGFACGSKQSIRQRKRERKYKGKQQSECTTRDIGDRKLMVSCVPPPIDIFRPFLCVVTAATVAISLFYFHFHFHLIQ